MKRTLRWIGAALLTILVLLVIAGFVLHSKGGGIEAVTYEVDPSGLIDSAPSDSLSIARGDHLTAILACRDCHSDDLSGMVLDEPPFLVTPSNLTTGEGGIANSRTDADLDRAIRYGVKKDGAAVFPIMPSKFYHHLSDEDVGAIIAYLRSLPPVDNVLPASHLKTLGKLLVGAGAWDYTEYVSTSAHRTATPPKAVSVEYGEYLAKIACMFCHGETLVGGVELDPNAPIPPDISGAGGWPIDLFDKAVRQGIGSAGNELHEFMPSRHFAKMSDAELNALHEYFKSILPTGTGDSGG